MDIGSERFQERGHHTHTHRGNDLPMDEEGHDTTHTHLNFFVLLAPLSFGARIVEGLACWSRLVLEGERPQTPVEQRLLADLLKQWLSNFLSSGPISTLKNY